MSHVYPSRVQDRDTLQAAIGQVKENVELQIMLQDLLWYSLGISRKLQSLATKEAERATRPVRCAPFHRIR